MEVIRSPPACRTSLVVHVRCQRACCDVYSCCVTVSDNENATGSSAQCNQNARARPTTMVHSTITAPYLKRAQCESRDPKSGVATSLISASLGALHSKSAGHQFSGRCYIDTSEKLRAARVLRYPTTSPALRGSSTLTNSQLNQYGRSCPFTSGNWWRDGIGLGPGGVEEDV